MNLLGWVGPVSARDLSSVPLPPGWRLSVCNRGAGGGIGSQAFRERAAAGGFVALFPEHEDADRIVVAGWSAGGAAVDEALKTQADDARLRLILCLDGYYNSEGAAAEVKAGYYRFGRRAAAGRSPQLILTTGQTGGLGHLDSTTSVRPLADALALRPSSAPRGALDVGPPVGVDGRGGVSWVRYGSDVEHTEHATRVAPAILRGWFHGGRRGGSLLAAGLAALFLAGEV